MGRPSRVRNAVAELIEASDRHDWTIEAVLGGLMERRVAADPSSVFRALVHLADAGVIERVQLGDGKMRFEAGREHHEHLRCECCGTIEALPRCALASVAPEVRRSTGFIVEGHLVVLTGRCGECAAAPD